MKFAFEDLEVYKRSIQFVSEIETFLEQEKINLRPNLTNPLSRAALSIPLNIAEGKGRWPKATSASSFG